MSYLQRKQADYVSQTGGSSECSWAHEVPVKREINKAYDKYVAKVLTSGSNSGEAGEGKFT